MKSVDNFLDKITMYRIVLYILIGFVLIASALSFFGLLSYNPIGLLFSAFFITTICLIINILFAWAFDVPANFESVYITALILSLIITPIQSLNDGNFFLLAICSSIIAMGLKYLVAIKHKHIFNPAAIAVVITAFTINQSASWWIGTFWMMPFVLIGGFLITRKIHRFDLVISFCVLAIIMISISDISKINMLPKDIWRMITMTPMFFFATVMLTEPLTTPPRRFTRILYGSLVGFLFFPMIHVGSVYSTPELALIVGNLFSYIISPKERMILKLKNVQRVAHDTYDFIFKMDRPMNFMPGQYLEWTLSDRLIDSRGNRRYFTIASSPTEPYLIMGIKFYPKASAFKKQLASLKLNDTIIASQRSGDFTLPKNKKKKLVFIAGGIGVTPFRSMIKYLIDKKEIRDIVVLYSNRTIEDIAYSDIFDQAQRELGIKVIYILTDINTIPDTWNGKKGILSENEIIKEIPDFKDRTFYLSGPHGMVVGFENTLSNIGVHKTHVKKDYFPGFA
jgi:ferredoxin-NADP reductase